MIAMSVIELNENNFPVVLKSEKPVLIDFWASWCVPCRLQSSAIEELANELDGSAVIAKLNVEKNPEIAAQFSVMSIPTLVFIRDGKMLKRKTGVTSKAAIVSILNAING